MFQVSGFRFIFPNYNDTNDTEIGRITKRAKLVTAWLPHNFMVKYKLNRIILVHTCAKSV